MQGILAWAREIWPVLVSIAYVSSAAWVTVDAVLRKRHVPAIVGWVGLAWLAPVVGALGYYLLGINRIRRSATALDRSAVAGQPEAPCAAPESARGEAQDEALDAMHPGFAGLARLGARVTGRSLLDGNRIEPLLDGDELGHVVDRLSGEHNTKQKGGAIAYLTQGRLGRRELYVQGLMMALVPFLNPQMYGGAEI